MKKIIIFVAIFLCSAFTLKLKVERFKTSNPYIQIDSICKIYEVQQTKLNSITLYDENNHPITKAYGVMNSNKYNNNFVFTYDYSTKILEYRIEEKK